MALGIYEEEDIRAIAISIRDNSGLPIEYTTKDMPNGIKILAQNNHDEGEKEGYDKGKTDGIAEGIEQGKTEANAVFENANSDLEMILYGEQRGYPVQNNMSQAKFDLYEIGEAIRKSGVTPSKTTEGYAENIGEIYRAGRKSQYDEFWDDFQWDGTRTYYPMYGFGQGSWSFDNFYPKYDIKPENACQYLFYGWINYKNYTDYPAVTGSLKKRLEECGVVLDTSKATLIRSMFAFTRFTEIPTIDCTGLTHSSTSDNIFSNNSQLVTIEKIIVAEYVKIDRWFDVCPALENLIIEGTIGQNGFDVKSSTKLSKASWISIMTAASTTASITITGSLVSVNKAFETSPGANDGSTSPEWLALKAARPTVSVSLV